MPKPATKKAGSNGQGHVTRHEKWKSEGRIQKHFITSEGDDRRLKAAAEATERPEAWIMRQALREWLDRHEKRHQPD